MVQAANHLTAGIESHRRLRSYSHCASSCTTVASIWGPLGPVCLYSPMDKSEHATLAIVLKKMAVIGSFNC